MMWYHQVINGQLLKCITVLDLEYTLVTTDWLLPDWLGKVVCFVDEITDDYTVCDPHCYITEITPLEKGYLIIVRGNVAHKIFLHLNELRSSGNFLLRRL